MEIPERYRIKDETLAGSTQGISYDDRSAALRAVFFSDVHLVQEDTDKTELVQGFLKDCCADADMIFILGDLFEFYHGYDGYIYPWYKGVIDALKRAY